MASGGHDRRGFDWAMKLSFVCVFLSVGMMILYSWTVGLAFVLYFCLVFIVLEAASAPPLNRVEHFLSWQRRQERRRPVLLCLGDSLTHGNMSASITPEIPVKLRQQLGLPPPNRGTGHSTVFVDPLWVVNAGQNFLTTRVLAHERLHRALGCHPDFILILIGTNDVIGMSQPAAAGRVMKFVNNLLEVPNLNNFERYFKDLMEFITQAAPMAQIAVCTLPPLSEDLTGSANQLVRQANDIIERWAQKAAKENENRVVVLPLFQHLEEVLEKSPRKARKNLVPAGLSGLLGSFFAVPYFHLLPSVTWNGASWFLGYQILSDGIHLNERGLEVWLDLVVEWLLNKNVAKAIAVKS